MSLKSRFKIWAFLPFLLSLLVTGILPLAAEKLLSKQNASPFGLFIFFGFFTIIWIWLVFGELRTKLIKVEIQDEEIIVSNYLGLGAERVYNFSQFDGFETALLPSTYDTYEYLYLVKNGKKVVKFSQFYHRNYADLKNTLTRNVRSLGQKRFSYIQEFKEIFI